MSFSQETLKSPDSITLNGKRWAIIDEADIRKINETYLTLEHRTYSVELLKEQLHESAKRVQKIIRDNDNYKKQIEILKQVSETKDKTLDLTIKQYTTEVDFYKGHYNKRFGRSLRNIGIGGILASVIFLVVQ